MARWAWLKILVAVLLLPFEPFLCLAQSPAPPTVPLPPATSPASVEGAEQLEILPTPVRQKSPLEEEPPRVPGETTPPSQKSPMELPPPPGGETVELPLPPLQAGDLAFPINLAAALRLADARPLIVAAAQATAWMAEAELQKAKVLWLPAFVMNAAYLRHDGPVDFNRAINVPQGENALGQKDLASFGKPLNQNFNWFYSGVSLYQVIALTDAIFQPLAARQNLKARRWDIQTAKNDALLETAQAYFNVHKYRGQYAGALYCVEQGRKLAAAIDTISPDLAPRVEVDRARTLLADLEQQAVSAREDWRIASADLTQVLRLDPRAVVQPLEHDHLQLTLIDPDRSLDELLPIGLTNRPELAAQQAVIQAALVRIRQEKMRPLLPSILITGWETPGGMVDQAGIFGTGYDGRMNLWSFRDDIATQLVWQWDSFGLGNLALVKKRRGEQSRATAALFHMQDAVAAEINQTQANLQSAATRVIQAERELRTGLTTFQKSLEGLGETQRFQNVLQLIYRPQEVVYALKLLKLSFDKYFATVAEYNSAQFQLFHALGYPAREISYWRPPDGLSPVDTSRPGYLPPVGTGPPPPSR